VVALLLHKLREEGSFKNGLKRRVYEDVSWIETLTFEVFTLTEIFIFVLW
jgi:hypothetical protein